MSMTANIVDTIINFLVSFSNRIGLDIIFAVALGVEVLFVLFFLIKSAFSYESTLNRALDKLNYWVFERKVITEENIREFNALVKAKAPKRLCYFWQQYILFREGTPSAYLSTENLVDKPLKTSSYNSNIKNLTIFTMLWSVVVSMFIIIVTNSEVALLGRSLAMAILVPLFVALIGIVFIVYLRARKNSIMNSLYQNVSTFGRFMDNACVNLPSYIDYQILFTPAEIEKGQPVLREFLDYKARKEKEEFQRAKEEQVDYEKYNFSTAGVDGSIVLDRAMKESEVFLKKKEKILVKVSQLEAELDSRRKNFDGVQKDYQTKIQASKENVSRLRQMQEETTNRIESNYYRKQQTQEIGKQEQYEQEFEQHKAKYLLEKSECEEEIAKLNNELTQNRENVEKTMMSEYNSFYNKFCASAEKVVGKVFADKIASLKNENERAQQRISELEIRLKNVPQGQYDGSEEVASQADGSYDEQGNYVYSNGTYYDPQGNFHDENGNIYDQDGNLLAKAEKKPINLDDYNAYDFMTDVSQKDKVYNVAENIVKNVDTDNEIDFENEHDAEVPVNDYYGEQPKENYQQEQYETDYQQVDSGVTELVDDYDDSGDVDENKPPKRKVGRPRKVVEESDQPKEKRRVGRPRKETVETEPKEKRKVGRPKKIVKEDENPQPKRGRGRPKKQIGGIEEINKKLSEEEMKMDQMRSSIDEELESAVNGIDEVEDKQEIRENLLNEIDALQKEAQDAIDNNESEERLIEINDRLEALLDEINALDNE